MDKKGFDIINQAYSEDLENLRAKIRAEIEAEQRENRGFKFSEHEAGWKLQKYPYAATERNKARNSHNVALANREAKILEEVEQRLAKQRTTLEKLHFGELGRQQALENAQREEKIEAFKARKREQERQELEKNRAHLEQPAPNPQENPTENQQEREPINAGADFQKMNEQARQQMEIEEKIQAFKSRVRQRETAEQSIERNRGRDGYE